MRTSCRPEAWVPNEESGLVRAGSDPRVALAARRKALLERIADLEPRARAGGDVRAA